MAGHSKKELQRGRDRERGGSRRRSRSKPHCRRVGCQVSQKFARVCSVVFIYFDEVSKAIDSAKLHKSFLEIPNEALKNMNAKLLMHKFYSICFETGLCPTDWNKSDIKPIPKKDKDKRDPLSNRCITIMCCVAKIYSSILNNRIAKFLENNNILVEEQNGFRAARSCIDHIFVLCTIIRNRKETGKQTFLCFIDFTKAFDSVDRSLLLHKLSKLGIVGKMYRAISAMFKGPKSRVILTDDHKTDYFFCNIGVKQGDSISPTLFACYLNDLSEQISATNLGVSLSYENDENLTMDTTHFKVSNLLYADDIVLLAESENDIQQMLNVVYTWCKKWRMEVNLSKTNILHIRKKNQQRSRFNFKLGLQTVEYCKEYKYLGITLNEYLDYNYSTQILAESGGRALSSIITKMIKNGGFPLNVYKILFNSSVCSVTDYGGEVWGYKEYEAIKKIQLKACRAYLGVPKNTPIPGLLSEINWNEPRSRTQLQMIRHYHRLLKMDNNRLSKRVYLWDRQLNDVGTIKTWSTEVKSILQRNGLQQYYNQGLFPLQHVTDVLKKSLLNKDQANWKASCLPLPKLRTFNKLKDFTVDSPYIFKPLSFMQRKSLAKFRLGLLHLRIETARFIRPRVPPEERFCLICGSGEVEDEAHFLLACREYSQLREILFNSILDQAAFFSLNHNERLNFLVNDPSIVKKTAKFIVEAFDHRSKLI